MNKSGRFEYDNLIEKISRSFLSEINKISVNYNFDLGDEFEIALCKVLRSFLPTKYGVCRGFVVSKDGEKEGDDIIIYDQEIFPTFRFLDKNDFSRSEEIPIEAVYAYIEAKNTLDYETLPKAFDQVRKVKRLCYQRAGAIQTLVVDSNNIVIPNFIEDVENVGILNRLRNPVYGMIIANKCIGKDGKDSTPDDIQKFLMDEFSNGFQGKVRKIRRTSENPDFIIAGKDNVVVPSIKPSKLGINPNFLLLTPFYCDMNNSMYQINIVSGIAYGLGIAHMMIAFNQIKLNQGDILWSSIFNDSKVQDKTSRSIVKSILDKDGEKYFIKDKENK